jgi:hypothetical protein
MSDIRRSRRQRVSGNNRRPRGRRCRGHRARRRSKHSRIGKLQLIEHYIFRDVNFALWTKAFITFMGG